MKSKNPTTGQSSSNVSLANLVRRAQQGDRNSYDKIVSRFQHMALAYGCSVIGDRSFAEDAAQEAFVEAFLNLEKLCEPAAFPGWLRTIIYRRCHRILRRRQVETIPLNTTCELMLDAMSPAEALEIAEVRKHLSSAIESLAGPERLAVTLYYLGEQSVSEMAAFLSLPTNTIKSACSQRAK
ncbi:MAG TPA: RNA polymerase sigma factor, partial [Capsulimonadaceae bacterium]|nr:RNA polymerase sigma factor [Capsulimonadaceae bacterium]